MFGSRRRLTATITVNVSPATALDDGRWKMETFVRLD
jgi:hypothetical protein